MEERATKKSCVTVLGAVNVDIGGASYAPLVAADSNPGRVRTSLGGVGRNIAHNLALLGERVRLVTAFGRDVNAERIMASCAELGIDVTDSLFFDDEATSSYLYIADSDGDMALAVSDMSIYERVTGENLAAKLDAVNASAAVVLDANLPEDTIGWLCERVTAPVFADPVSTVKASRLRDVLGKLAVLKPNTIEAELLTGIRIHDEQTLQAAADRLLHEGVGHVCISLGAEGMLSADGSGRLRLPSRVTKLVNATGGGDALMAGLTWGRCAGLDAHTAARAGMAAACIALESRETVNPLMSADLLRERMALYNQ